MTSGDYVVADAEHTCVFSNDEPWADILPRLAAFSIAPATLQELVSLPTGKRPDLLVGRLFGTILRLPALDIGLEPICSTVIHRVVTKYGLDGCQRVRADGDPDTINTPRALILGALPGYVYHGTSDLNLPTIRDAGLCTDQPANWPNGGRDHVYLAAEAQVSAFHARRTAAKQGGQPVVLKCRLPTTWVADHDVNLQMVQNSAVPSADPVFLAQEAGLFATPAAIPWSDILEVRSPVLHERFDTWSEV